MNENEAEEYFLTIFLSHGKSPLWQEVANYIEQKLAHEVVEFTEGVNQGRTVIQKLEQDTEECAFGIIVLTADDETGSGSPRSKEKILHEIGYCQGTFGRENLLVLKQDGVEEFADLAGVIYVPFTGNEIKSTFSRLQTEIEAAIDRFEDEDEETDEDE